MADTKCIVCGVMMLGVFSNKRVCSRRCQAWRKRHPNEAAPERTGRTCALCGVGIDHMDIRTKFCSKLCHGRHYDQSEVDVPAACVVCDQKFLKRKKSSITCSEACGRTLDYRSHFEGYIRRSMERTVLLKTGRMPDESFDRAEIFARDGYICYLCGLPTDPTKMGGRHPDMPSIDHVIPLSRGGTHTRDNVRCTHLSCNNSKGARDVAGRGPAPKPTRSRKRDAVELTEIVMDGDVLHGPPLPEGVLPDGAEWHPQTRDLWLALRRNPLLADEPSLGWSFLIDTALMHHLMWAHSRWDFASEVRLRLAKVGTTPEDRLRLRVKVLGPDAAVSSEPAAPVGAGVADIASRRERLTS